MPSQPLRALRVRKDWTQADLAKKAGISQTYLSLVERGQARGLSLRLARRLAALVGSTTEETFDDAYTLEPPNQPDTQDDA